MGLKSEFNDLAKGLANKESELHEIQMQLSTIATKFESMVTELHNLRSDLKTKIDYIKEEQSS